MIPLVDLGAQYRNIEPEISRKLRDVLESTAFIQGPFVSEFERAFLAAHDAQFGSGCASGTAALYLALVALGVGPGDEVIIPANTFIATAEAVVHAGATPVFADVDPETALLDVDAVLAALTRRTRALVPVHLFGSPCDMTALCRLARDRNLLVVEDAAQAHLARLHGQAVGTFGDAAAFSFYPGKNLGAYGDAGFVFARTAAVEGRIRKLLDHGRTTKYEHDLVGGNHRLDALQAAVLSVKLAHLPAWTEARRALAARYDSALAPAGLRRPGAVRGAEPVWHLYTLEVSNRVEVMHHLQERGIASGIHYPLPLHLQPAFASLGGRRGALPVVERLAERLLSLPLYPELAPVVVDEIAAAVVEVAAP